MTLHRAVWYTCDACGETSGDGSLGDATVARARAAARRAGWRLGGSQHLCRGCGEDLDAPRRSAAVDAPPES